MVGSRSTGLSGDRADKKIPQAQSTQKTTLQAHTATSGLSVREKRILQCLKRGQSNKEIARSLAIAEVTVKVHIKHIVRKLQVRNRIQAAIWAANQLDSPASQKTFSGSFDTGTVIKVGPIEFVEATASTIAKKLTGVPSKERFVVAADPKGSVTRYLRYGNAALLKGTRRRGMRRYAIDAAADLSELTSSSAAAAPSAKPSEDAYKPDGRARAILRFARIAEDTLRHAGGAYALDEVIDLLKISKQAIAKRVKEGTLVAVPGPHNMRCYPTFQFTGDGTVVRGLKELQEALPTKNAWTVLNFIVTPDDYLNGRKPIEVLREGRIEAAVAAAHRYGEQGA